MRLIRKELKTIMNRGARQKRTQKYKNVKKRGYASKKEANRADELKSMQSAGLISDLVEQPRFKLLPKQDGERAVHYVADFKYNCDGKVIVEDVKSDITRRLPQYVIKRKLMLYIHGIRITEV